AGDLWAPAGSCGYSIASWRTGPTEHLRMSRISLIRKIRLVDWMATHAVADLFQRCYTIELSPELHRRTQIRPSHLSHVTCIRGERGAELPRILAHVDESALFWLDAHASGGQTADAGFDPILRELDAIYRHPVKRHVILIDDARGHAEAIWKC